MERKNWHYFALASLSVSYFCQVILLIAGHIFSGALKEVLFCIAEDLSFVIFPLVCVVVFFTRNLCNNSSILLISSWLGLLGVIISPAFSDNNVTSLMGVAITENLPFISGFVLIFCSLFFATIFTDYFAIIVFQLIIILLFILSHRSVNALLYQMDIGSYYYFLFRSISCAFKFFATEIMMVAWIFMTKKILKRELYYQNFCNWILWLNLAFILPIFYIHFTTLIDSAEAFEFFTDYTKYTVQISPFMLFIILLSEYRIFRFSLPILYFFSSALLCAIELFSLSSISPFSSVIVALVGLMFGSKNSFESYLFIIGELISTICYVFWGGDILLDIVNSTSIDWTIVTFFTCGKILSTIGISTFMIRAFSLGKL
ncbi:MAG: hypothetical protein KA998_01465 [Rickettsiaceae bacterium]|nr:hypothetical protein [Rickettsiaceae bacterium]